MVVGGSYNYAIVVVASAFGCSSEKVFKKEVIKFSPIYHPALSCSKYCGQDAAAMPRNVGRCISTNPAGSGKDLPNY